MSTQHFANSASGDAHVDVQAGVVHGDIYYQVAADASPEEVFHAGVRFLGSRMPAEARELIEKAAARGYETDEVRFYRLLALLSGRTLRQLGDEDLDILTAMCARMGRLDGDAEWTAGLRAALALITSLSNADATLVDKELSSLQPLQRNLIIDHLGVLLDGPMEDEMWRRAADLAAARRTADDRANRVWAFFQPEPAPARAAPVRPAHYPAKDMLKAGLGSLFFLYAAGSLGALMLSEGDPLPIFALLVTFAAAVVFVRYGAEWHFRRQRVAAKDQRLTYVPPEREAPPDGFARGVDALFDRYFSRYVPRDADRESWLQQSAGARQLLRDEVVDIYREQRTQAKQLAWLVRYLAGEAKHRQERHTVTAYRAELRTPARVKAWCLAAAAAFVAAALIILATQPPSGAGWSVVAAVAGGFAVRGGFRIDSERRRVGADEAERAVTLQERQDAYLRWIRKLQVKPADPEMAMWLEADRRIQVDQAMRHYRLTASRIIAHAVIEGPAPGAKRARVKHGPWRYSKYQMVLFLLTEDGVRQLTVHVDFESADSRITERLTYRFDQVTSVRVVGMATQRQTFELTLVNGSPVAMTVTEAAGELEPGEDPVKLSQVSLDASGLPHTLNILEGIAAEGKEWVRHQRRRTDQRIADLTQTLDGLTKEPPPDPAP